MSRMSQPATGPAPAGEDPGDALAGARRRGREEAERFDQELRRAEVEAREAGQRHRQRRLAAAASRPGSLPSSLLLPTRPELEELRRFHHAVVTSRSWRLLQGLRRLVGRAW